MFTTIGQPPVIGEMIAGVVLGPSVLGALWPAAGAFILPTFVAPSLSVVAQLGVVLNMFLVGLELNPDALRGQLRATVAISQTSIVVPFVLGWALAVYLYPRFSSYDVPFVSFALFLGIAMSITAFPVLARILADLGMTRTPARGRRADVNSAVVVLVAGGNRLADLQPLIPRLLEVLPSAPRSRAIVVKLER